jgi:excinuclease ABC subunit C
MLDSDLLISIPHLPGVYLMLDNKSAVLYVGKAKDLNKRLASYVHYKGVEHNKTAVMLKQVQKVDTILTNTEKEALILESSLIKKHKPKYNIILRDDKSYPYIKVTVGEEWPRVYMSRRKSRDHARYFGPYSSSSAMWATLKLIGTIFPLRKCKGGVLKKRERPCLNYQINKCLAPCAGQADYRQYQEHVRQILMLLEGRNRELVSLLRAEMTEAAENLDFERAASLRDQISALERTLEKQVISAAHDKDQDVFGLARNGAYVTIVVLYVRNGLLTGTRAFWFSDPIGDDQTILSQAVGQFYDQNSTVPDEVLLPCEVLEIDLLSEYLSDTAGKKISLYTPKRGDRQKLINLAITNARQLFEERQRKEQSWDKLAELLKKVLHLQQLPHVIECLDISNIGGKQAVGSLVCFSHGEPDKKRYRHYKIRSVDQPNDYAMMAEVLERRMTRGKTGDHLPNLLLVDGGKGQLGIAVSVAKTFGDDILIEWAGIAKERADEGEKLYRPERKNPIILPPHNPALLYLMRIRDEAHRYGIAFHRRLRNKATLTSLLDRIPGIGENKKTLLLQHFGSLKKIKSASVEQLQQVKGIGPELAKTIHLSLHE